jgi:hypothetical protein
METSLRLKGDFTNSFTEWTDAYINLLRYDNVESLVQGAAFDSPIVLSANDTVKDKQERNLNSFFNELNKLAGSDELRQRIRNVERSNQIQEPGLDGGGVAILVNFDISQLIFKIRYVIKIFNEICAPNDIKDSVMLANISSMRYVQTSNVREDVSKLISQYDRYDAEMSNSQKQPLSQKKKFVAKLLAGIPLISYAIMQHQLHHSASTWDVFRSTVLRACHGNGRFASSIRSNGFNFG